MTHTIYYHADDYGVCAAQCEQMLALSADGCLNSISLFPNSPYTAQAYARIKADTNTNSAGTAFRAPFLRVAAHLNLIEGKSAAPAGTVPLLTDERGMLRCTFGYLLKANFALPRKKRAFREQLKTEIAAQLAVISDLTGSKHLCIDSHQHFHMIPLVFHALSDVVSERGYVIDSLRIPVDPIRPVLTTPRLFLKIPPVNFIKYALLRILSWFILPEAKRRCPDIPVFFGIFYTCRMEYGTVAPLLKKYERIAEKQHRNLELMFHPGGVYDTEELLDPANTELAAFYSDPYRKKEADALMRL